MLNVLSKNLMKQHVRLYAYQAPSIKTKTLKRYVPSLGSSGKSSVIEKVETKYDDLTIAAAVQRWHHRAMHPGYGKFSFMKLHRDLMNGYKSAYILPKRYKMGKTKLLTLRQLDQILSTTSLIICSPFVYLFYVKSQQDEVSVLVPNHETILSEES